jgi:hypothetical protein
MVADRTGVAAAVKYEIVIDGKTAALSIAGERFEYQREGGSPIGYHGKNRSFFFFSYEGTRQRQGLTLPTVTVPTDAQRAAVTDPSVLKLLPLIPRSSTGLTSGSATAPVNIDQWTLDVSHNFTVKDRLHGYYAFQRDFRGEPSLQGNNIPGFGDSRHDLRRYIRHRHSADESRCDLRA